MNTISNERLDSIERQFIEDGFNDITDSEVAKLVSEVRALRKERQAAVPVAWRWGYRMSNGEMSQWRLLKVEPGKGSHPDFPRIIEPLYTVPPAPVAQNHHAPDLGEVVSHFRDLNEGFPVERFKADYVIAWMLANYPPAPVVPTFDEWLEIRGNKPLGWVKDAMRESYDACRAAMLKGADDATS